MITRLWPLTLLVTQLVLGYDHSIDLTRCKTETACFIRETCLKATSTPWKADKLVHYTGEALEKDNYCDVILQMKALTPKSFHVMMEVKSDAEAIQKDSVKLNQGANQFHCKENKNIGRTGLELKDEGTQKFEDKRIFCSFIVTLQGPIFNLNEGLPDPDISFTKGADGNEKIGYGGGGEMMWQTMRKSCDYSKISSKATAEEGSDVIVTDINTFYPPCKCTTGKLKLKPDPGEVEEDVSEVFCDNDKWKKKVPDSSGTLQEAVVAGQFSVYCSEKVCLKCDAPPKTIDKSECPDCNDVPPAFTAAAGEDCPKLTCENTNNKWTVTGNSIIEGEAKCAQSIADPTKYGWFVGNTELTTKAGCLDELDCSKRYGNGYPTIHPPKEKESCDVGTGCPFAQAPGGNEYSCKPDFSMRLMDGDNDVNSDKIVDKIVCDKTTGDFIVSDPKAKYNLSSFSKLVIRCYADAKANAASAAGALSTDKLIVIGGALGGLAVFIGVAVFIYWFFFKKKKKKNDDEDAKQASTRTKSKKSTKSAMKTGTLSSTQTGSAAAGEPGVDTSDGKKKSTTGSKKEKKKEEKKFKLEEYEVWDNEQFVKKILPNFKNCQPEAKTKWVRNCLCRFYAYCNPKKVLVGSTMLSLLDSRMPTPESGTINQFWLFVKQCSDDKCEDAGVWRELWRTAFTLIFSVIEKTTASDEFRLLAIKPFEAYMVEYLKKCDIYKRKDEPRSETEMRVICIEILIHTRHPDITEVLRKLTFNEKLEVPLRMLTSACYTRERDEKPGSVQLQYIRVVDTSVIDPHISEGWGTYLQHCLFGLAGFLITVKEQYQYYLFDAIYQFPMQKDGEKPRKFSPSDWLYAYKGALLHENSAKIAMEMFKKCNEGSLLHIDTLLKQKHKNEEDKEEREKTREQYRKDMKEFTQLLADLLVGEEDFNDFKQHLRFVLIFVGDMAKQGEPLDEERIRERAINIGNMVRDPGFAKEAGDCLKAIGAKTSA